MNQETLERAYTSSLYFMWGMATIDLLLYTWAGTAAFTVLANLLTLWLFFRHSLRFDLVKLIESTSLFCDIYLLLNHGYAIASPIATLFVIIHVSMNKHYQLEKLKFDLEKVLESRKKSLESRKKDMNDDEKGKKPEA